MNKKLASTEKKKIKGIIKYNCIIFVIVILCLNVSGGFNLFGGQGCISVVFDKWDMMHVNKIYLYVGDKQSVITDEALIQQIKDVTTVASMTDAQFYPDVKMELYHNDKLVRQMSYNTGSWVAKVYEADVKHWIWPSNEGEGFISLPQEVVYKLQEIIDAQETP